MAIIFHTREQETFINRLNGAAKFIFLILASIAISLSNIYLAFSMFALSIILAIWIKLPLISYLKEGFIFILLVVFIAITEYLNTHSVLLTAYACVKFLSVLIFALILTDTTSSSDIARGIGTLGEKIFSSYAWHFASLVELTIGMIPLVFDTVLSIYDSRRARCDSFIKHPIKSITSFSISVFIALLDEAFSYVDALESRNYDINLSRPSPKFKARDIIVILIAIAILILSFL